MRKSKNTPKAERGHFATAEVEPKRKVAEFRVNPENMIESAPRSPPTISFPASSWT